MSGTVLGLDVGGANVKAATADGRAWSEPFALWKDPDGLAAVLAETIARFPDSETLAVTMTGELCDCYRTKREGVNRILDAVEEAANGREIHIWSTAGRFVSEDQARAGHLKVASANWHALATFAGRYVPSGIGLLIDIGSTTTDLIMIANGEPVVRGLTDPERLKSGELVYTGVRRTPVFSLVPDRTSAEFFATMHDVYLVLEVQPADAADMDTADGRPATVEHARARLARVVGGDIETVSSLEIAALAHRAYDAQRGKIVEAALHRLSGTKVDTVICSGSGEFLGRAVTAEIAPDAVMISLEEMLGARTSACSPAYASAVLASDPTV
jgi:(4-(4-[2-(gamma-L-glutamylamino)ethyl]phenoxymethyl)furan-2-yl)methanamine synthase